MNAVIFDFDGTIADSFDQVLEFLQGQSSKPVPALTADERAHLKGLSMKDLALRVGVPAWKLPLVYFRGKAKLTSNMHTTQIFNGMDAVLAALQNEGYRLFIISSNSKRNINLLLSQKGLSGYFNKVYGNAGWFGKAGALRKALKNNRLQAESTIYVGDEVRDMIAAQIAGMPSVAVAWGFGSEAQLLKHNPTILVRTPEELQKSLIDWGRTL